MHSLHASLKSCVSCRGLRRISVSESVPPLVITSTLFVLLFLEEFTISLLLLIKDVATMWLAEDATEKKINKRNKLQNV